MLAAADESRMLVDVLCKRVIRPKFESGVVPGRVSSADELAEIFCSSSSSLPSPFARELVTDAEWSEACQRVNTWQDEIEANEAGESPLAHVLRRVGWKKFPTIDRVRTLVGEELADLYSDALEKIESDPESFPGFPEDRSGAGWNARTAERAASLVIDVISPHGTSDPQGMAQAFVRFQAEDRAQREEKKTVQDAGKDDRKKAARQLGIWLPRQTDLKTWETDERTARRAVAFQTLSSRVVDKMRVLRTVLQYVPRRKFSNKTVADLNANMERMRAYLRDDRNKALRAEKNKKKKTITEQ